MTVAAEARAIEQVLGDVALLEEAASALADVPASDTTELTARLLARAHRGLSEAAPVRARAAADLLGITERTVRTWVEEGVLTATTIQPRLLLDLGRIHQVQHLLQELRAAGRTTGLLDEVFRRLTDAAWHDNPGLAEGLAQMRRGEGTVIRRSPTAV